MVARILTKHRYKTTTARKSNYFQCVPKEKQADFDREIMGLNWDHVVSTDVLGKGCNIFTIRIGSVIEQFTVKVQKNLQTDVIYPGLMKINGR